MPRNASGTYSKPAGTTAITGTTIESTPYNTLMDDIATALTGSLPRDGSGAMQGSLAMGGQRITGLADGVADTDAATKSQVDAITSGVIASGTIMLFQQTSAPSGWTKITTHNDKALRVVSGTAGSGGTTAFTSVFTSRTIAIANLPAHTHGPGTLGGTTSSNGDHTHDVTDAGTGSTNQGDGSGSIDKAKDTSTVRTTSTDGAHTHTITLSTGVSGSTGSGTAMDFAVQYVDVILASKN